VSQIENSISSDQELIGKPEGLQRCLSKQLFLYMGEQRTTIKQLSKHIIPANKVS
jgi:hypothetical protein